jgi:predicted nucleotidyltransferase
MRLNDKIREIIKTEVANQLGPDAVVRLFGSRVNDSQRGGDIDLLVESKLPLEHRIQAECKLAARLFIRLGGRKVDVIIKDPTMPSQLVHEQAITHGIIL